MAQRPITNDRQIQSLKAEAKPYFVAVSQCPGLRIKVHKGPAALVRTFLYRYRTPDGKLEQKVIGKYQPPQFGLQEARAKWREYRDIREEYGSVRKQVAVTQAENFAKLRATLEQSEKDTFTVAKLAREFIDFQSARIKTWRKTESNLNAYVIPHLGMLPAHGIRRSDVTDVLDKLTGRGLNVTANRVLAAVSKMFNWAVQRDKPGIEFNPCASIEKQKEQSRERFLSDVELRRLFVHLPDSTLKHDERDLLEFILLTGCRLSEAVGARVAEFEGGVWVLPRTRSKNKREHRLPLSNQALALVARRRLVVEKSEYLFPLSTDGSRPMRPDHIHMPLREAIPALKVQHFTPHDLRRSFATGLARVETPRVVISLALNHTIPGVTSVYDKHGYEPELKKALQKWADHLDQLRGEKSRLGSRASMT